MNTISAHIVGTHESKAAARAEAESLKAQYGLTDRAVKDAQEIYQDLGEWLS